MNKVTKWVGALSIALLATGCVPHQDTGVRDIMVYATSLKMSMLPKYQNAPVEDFFEGAVLIGDGLCEGLEEGLTRQELAMILGLSQITSGESFFDSTKLEQVVKTTERHWC